MNEGKHPGSYGQVMHYLQKTLLAITIPHANPISVLWIFMTLN